MMKSGVRNNLKKKEVETDLQKDAIELIKNLGGYVVKYHVTSFQSQGVPDLIVCYQGRFVVFELKVGRNKSSVLQQHRIEQINRAGGVAKKDVTTLDEIKETLYEISRIQQGNEPE